MFVVRRTKIPLMYRIHCTWCVFMILQPVSKGQYAQEPVQHRINLHIDVDNLMQLGVLVDSLEFQLSNSVILSACPFSTPPYSTDLTLRTRQFQHVDASASLRRSVLTAS